MIIGRDESGHLAKGGGEDGGEDLFVNQCHTRVQVSEPKHIGYGPATHTRDTHTHTRVTHAHAHTRVYTHTRGVISLPPLWLRHCLG